MDKITDQISEIQKKLAGKTEVNQLSPEERDALLDNLYKLGVHENLITRLSEHYGVRFKSLLDLCLSRQLVYLHVMTDYSKEGSEASLQQLLRTQQTATATLIAVMNARISNLDEALRQTEYLRDQAVQILAMYKTKFLQEAAPTNPN